MVEQLICNHYVVGSNPTFGSIIMSILITNHEDRQKEAQRQDDLDLALESTMQRSLNSLTRTIVDNFAILYATTGQIIDISNYINELEAILTKTYRKVNNEFSQVYLDSLIDEKNKAATESRQNRLNDVIKIRNKTEPIILASLIGWSQLQAPQQRAFISNTWDKIIRKNVDDTMAEQIMNEKPIDNETIANKTKKPLNDELKIHNELISTQEVQTATENAKYTEVNELNTSLKTNQTIAERIEKVWVTMGDLKVRDAHMRANNQRREINDPFLVGGELLMYPKDTSLGASMANVINCRCKSVYQ